MSEDTYAIDGKQVSLAEAKESTAPQIVVSTVSADYGADSLAASASAPVIPFETNLSPGSYRQSGQTISPNAGVDLSRNSSGVPLLMKKLTSVKKGPKGIVNKFNELIGVYNDIHLTPGRNISISSTGSGWIINALDPVRAASTSSDNPDTPMQSGSSGGGSGLPPIPDASTPQWTLITFYDDACNPHITYVLTGAVS